MLHLLQIVATQPDSTSATSRAVEVADKLASGDIHWQQVVSQLITWSLDAGRHILIALAVYLIGHYLIKFIDYLLTRFLERRKVELTVRTFIQSFVGILLQVLLIISVVSALGINTTSFAALLASFGVAVGMALSGNLQNFAGGIIILFLKPYKVGDWLEAQGTSGTVVAIQIFHTILQTADGRQVFVPNGSLSSGTITNYNTLPTRRVEWKVGVEYGEDIERVRAVVQRLLKSDKRIQPVPAPEVYLGEMADSSVNVLVRAWVRNADYWSVLFDINERIYSTFNAEGISFPFPQVTVHQAEA